MNDYERIARIIRYLEKHQTDQPDLTTLAAQAGLSPHHFHRLFSTWAAITPKDFLQCLTVSHAKELLRSGQNVLDASIAAGLSGPGRLHDLCVTLEAASPGEIKSGGEGWTIIAGFADSPFGKCLIGESPRGICHIAFVEPDHEKEEWLKLQENWPGAKLERGDKAAIKLSKRIFNHDNTSRPALRAIVKGTDFQIRVWRALLRVPPGSRVSYSQLAGTLGKSSAARAVGSAVGKNSLAYLVPCHRVIRESGVIGDYRWGHVRKRVILARESAAANW